jgi:hypothetical protein
MSFATSPVLPPPKGTLSYYLSHIHVLLSCMPYNDQGQYCYDDILWRLQEAQADINAAYLLIPYTPAEQIPSNVYLTLENAIYAIDEWDKYILAQFPLISSKPNSQIATVSIQEEEEANTRRKRSKSPLKGIKQLIKSWIIN